MRIFVLRRNDAKKKGCSPFNIWNASINHMSNFQELTVKTVWPIAYFFFDFPTVDDVVYHPPYVVYHPPWVNTET